MKNSCTWVWGKRKCKNQRHRFENQYCENHSQLAGQIRGYQRSRAFLIAAEKLVSDAEDKARNEIFTEYVSGCSEWSGQITGIGNTLGKQILDMDAIWNGFALPLLEKKAMGKCPGD